MGAKMLMVSTNLPFPQTFSSFLPSAGLSGSSWLLHPKIQLEFCCEISSAISSLQLRKAKHNHSGVWHEAQGVLAQRRSSKPELQLLSLNIGAHPSCKKLNPWWEGIFCCISTWFLPSCRQDPRLPLPVVAQSSP